MSILITALVLAAAPTPAAVQPAQAAAPAAHAHHAQRSQPAQPGAKPTGEGCSCCKDMGAGGKMECCAKHGEGHGEHSGQDAGHDKAGH